MKKPWAVNDDLENEFQYWVRELWAALKLGAVFAIVAGVLIALLPQGDGNAGAAFARDFWTYFAEAAFWLGMFLSMVRSAIKRAAAIVTGVPPWEERSRDISRD